MRPRRQRVEVIEVIKDRPGAAIVHLETSYTNETLCGLDLRYQLAQTTIKDVDCMTCLVHAEVRR